MFFSNIIFVKKSPLAKLWLAAHWQRKLTKLMINQTSIQESCDEIENPSVPLALRLSGQLLLGLVRIYDKKVRYLQEDATEALTKIKILERNNKTGGTIEIIEIGTSGRGIIRGRGVVSLAEDQLRAPTNLITTSSSHDIYDPSSIALDDVLQDHYLSIREARAAALAAVAASGEIYDDDGLILDMSDLQQQQSLNKLSNLIITQPTTKQIARESDISIRQSGLNRIENKEDLDDIDLLRRAEDEIVPDGEDDLMNMVDAMVNETGIAVEPEDESKEDKVRGNENEVSIDDVREAVADVDRDDGGMQFDDDSMDISRTSILPNKEQQQKQQQRDSLLLDPMTDIDQVVEVEEPGTPRAVVLRRGGEEEQEDGGGEALGAARAADETDEVAAVLDASILDPDHLHSDAIPSAPPVLTSSETASLRARSARSRRPTRSRRHQKEFRDHQIELPSAFIADCQRNYSDIIIDRIGTDSLLAPNTIRQRRNKQLETLASTTIASQHTSNDLFQLGLSSITLNPTTSSTSNWSNNLQSFMQQFLTNKPLNFIGRDDIIMIEEEEGEEKEENEEEKEEKEQEEEEKDEIENPQPNDNRDSMEGLGLVGPEDILDDFTQIQPKIPQPQPEQEDKAQTEKDGEMEENNIEEENKEETEEEKQVAMAKRIEEEAQKQGETMIDEEEKQEELVEEDEEKNREEQNETKDNIQDETGLIIDGDEEPLFVRRISQEDDAEREERLRQDLAAIARSSKFDALAARAASRFFSDSSSSSTSTSIPTDSQTSTSTSQPATIDIDPSATGYSKRTIKMHSVLKEKFEENEIETIGFEEILKDKEEEEKKEESKIDIQDEEIIPDKIKMGRNVAAGVFYQLLVLSSHGYISSTQSKPFAEIQVTRKPAFDTFRSGSQSSTSSQQQNSSAPSQPSQRSQRSKRSESESSVPESEREDEKRRRRSGRGRRGRRGRERGENNNKKKGKTKSNCKSSYTC